MLTVGSDVDDVPEAVMIMRHGRTTLYMALKGKNRARVEVRDDRRDEMTTCIRVERSRLVKMCLNKVIRERIVMKNKAMKGGRGLKKEKLGGEAVGA